MIQHIDLHDFFVFEISAHCYCKQALSETAKCPQMFIVKQRYHLHQIERFYIKMGEKGKGQDSGETQRERGRECECRTGRNMAAVVK